MTRLMIKFSPPCIFETQIHVDQVYINRGDHVGNGQYVELCNEASLRFFNHKGVAPYTIGEQVLLNTEFSVQLKSEARCFDVLTAELAVDNYHRCGFDFLFRLSQHCPSGDKHGQVVALAKFSFLCFDYQQHKVVDASPLLKPFFDACHS